MAAAALLALAACGGGHVAMARLGQARPSGGGGTAGREKHAAPVGDVYAAATSSALGVAVEGMPERVYVPNSKANTVDVIDPRTFQVIDHFAVGRLPHHVTPAWDLQHLYVDDTEGDELTVIDPHTGKVTQTVPVTDPYNLYFTPDGSKAIVVAERYKRLDFRDPHSWQLLKSVPIPWPGVDHLDFSADGSYLMVTTEYSGMVVKVDTVAMKVVGEAYVGGLPVDVKLSPDGSVFYVTNQGRDGVSIVDPESLHEIGFISTGKGAHGLYVSRDATSLYVSNRLAGSISVIDLASRRLRTTWKIGGSPDMIQLSPDGRQLWATGRYNAAVYVVDTDTGHLLHTIKVGREAHGLSYFPEPGRFSIGHNGVYR